MRTFGIFRSRIVRVANSDARLLLANGTKRRIAERPGVRPAMAAWLQKAEKYGRLV
jgi:hypothetical protein